ncbi:MAG TPA: GEVED domain-containing protein [Sedimentisphaerales bacterium]|nr:GEVED domain-containing protein [Sedimentisphaerales bacterium]
MKKFSVFVLVTVMIGAGSVAVGDWDPGELHKMHYPQLPDLNPTGMDVLAGPLSVDPDGTVYYEKFIADDFLCTESGPITGIHIWCSYRGDIKYMDPPFFSLVIYDNVPAGTGGIPWSRPGQALWDTYVQPTAERIYATSEESFYDPNPDMIVGNDTIVWQYNFEFGEDEAFHQERNEIYWLGIKHTFDLNNDGIVNLMDLFVLKMNWPGSFGWKTSVVEQYEDDAVWTEAMTFFDVPHVVPEGEIWMPMDYPPEHEYAGRSIDLAFVITGPAPAELDFGDAPRPYPTMLTVDGARHIIGGPYFCDASGGDSPDPEGDGQPDLNALGDDNDGNDDEDGVQIPPLMAGVASNITVMVCGSSGPTGAMVEIWIDWHSDGSFDASDMVFGGPLPDGVHSVAVAPPLDAVNGQTFARCRISTQGTGSPTGQAADGEVEDHKVYIEGGRKRPTPHLKWSQPPIPMYPLDDWPTFCGWDEPSWREWVDPAIWFDAWNCRTQCHGDADCDGDVDADDEAILMAAWLINWPSPGYDPRADFDRDLQIFLPDLFILNSNMGTNPPADCALRPELAAMVADDFRCLGTMPIKSIHWWGSYIGWDTPETLPPEQPIAWRIGFWSNDVSSQSCDFLYGAATGTTSGNAPSDLYKIDPTTGVATLIGPIGFNGVTGLSFAPDGTLYGTCHDTVTNQALLIKVDTMTGAGTLVGPVNTTGTGQSRVPDISFRSDGVLYGYGDGPDQLITIDTASGQGTAVGPTGYFGGGNGMDFAPDGRLYATPWDWNSLVIIDPATGAGADVPGSAGNVPNRINALEFCQQHGVLFGSWNDVASGNNYLVTLDLNTGLPLSIVQTVMGLDAIAFNEHSRPMELLHVFEVDASRVQIEPVGWDYYFNFYPSDACWQYYVKLEHQEVFWQSKYLPQTEDNIFWLSITALYPESDPPVDPQYPWGWKTRPWSWMDDAVRFWLYEAPAPGSADPCYLEPIKDPRYNESFDVTFELDTDPNYIKWEQPFTGLLYWPHFEDEWTMGSVESWTEYKWQQSPNPSGWDVALKDYDNNLLELADDWRCDETGSIDDIHLWVSWEGDWVGYIPWITVRIYTDDPCGPGGYSEPNELKWERTFGPGEFDMWWYGSGDQGWFEPVSWMWAWPNHVEFYQIDIDVPDNPFTQEQGNIYWLSIEASSVDGSVGWKTSSDQWNDDAVYKDPYSGQWMELYDPMITPMTSLDLAFALTTKKEELYINRLVADDWPCDLNTPITACVWWGSYIGYGYEACQAGSSFMPLPVPPDYFLLTIWDDVPLTSGDSDNCCFPHPWTGCDDPACEASVCSYDPYCCNTEWDSICALEARSDSDCDCGGGDLPYSHPNEAIWKYKAYDYDEVLVGYDKHPEGGAAVVFDGGAPDLLNGNEMTEWAQAEDFTLTAAATIESVRFWTLEGVAAWDGSCDYAIHTDAAGQPGALLDSGSVGLGRLSTGRTASDLNERENEFHLPAALPLSAGTYWLVLHMSSDCITRDGVYWETGSPGSGSTGLEDYECIGGPWFNNGSDHAFQLLGGGDPNEPVFRYSVRLPHDKWFLQDSNEGVYWFSAVPVYEQHPPNYTWGWTNHKHVYNDDAVEGYQDMPGGPADWTWYELFDQTGESEDMSFILFTDPHGYTCWDPLECAGQPLGDGTCDGAVNFLDLNQLKLAFFATKGQPLYNCCADYNHDNAVNFLDLNTLKLNFFTSGHTPATGNQNCPP